MTDKAEHARSASRAASVSVGETRVRPQFSGSRHGRPRQPSAGGDDCHKKIRQHG